MPYVALRKENNVRLNNVTLPETVQTTVYFSGKWAQKIIIDFGSEGSIIGPTESKVACYQWKRRNDWVDICIPSTDNGTCTAEIAEEMNEDVKFRSIDEKGKIGIESITYNFRIDNTKPSCELMTVGTIGSNDWYTSDVNIGFIPEKTKGESKGLAVVVSGVYAKGITTGPIGSAVSVNKPNFKAIYDGNGQEYTAGNPAPAELTEAVNKVTEKIHPMIVVINKGYNNSIVETPYPDGEIVMFNPVTGQKCNDYVEANSATGIKEGCLKWYTFGSISGSSAKLILDHNTTAAVARSTTGTNVNGPTTVKEKLNQDISSWSSSIKSSARLITAFEIANLVGNSAFTSGAGEAFYLQTGAASCSSCSSLGRGNAKYAWLFDRTGTTCVNYGCYNNAESNPPRGYWTSTPTAGYNAVAWFVNYFGQVNANATVNVANQ